MKYVRFTIWFCCLLGGLALLGEEKEAATEKKPKEATANFVKQPTLKARPKERINFFPEFAYYPSKPVPGYPGFRAPYYKMPPERQAYPGSVEHVRHWMMKYVPALPFYNQRSLVKNFIMKDLYADTPGALVDFQERIYCIVFPNDRGWYTRCKGTRTGRLFADPVKTLMLKPGDRVKPLVFGPLKRGMYVLRLISAFKEKDHTFPPKDMLFTLRINDGLNGKESVYRLRGRTMPGFYKTVEFFFYAWDQRTFRATLTYQKESEPVLYAYNIGLHNAWSEMEYRGIKQRQTLPTNPELVQALKKVLKKEAQRDQEDPPALIDAMWKALPPLNTMFAQMALTWAPDDPKKARRENRVNLKPKMWSYVADSPTAYPRKCGFLLTRSEASAKLDHVTVQNTPTADVSGLNPAADADDGQEEDDLELEEGPGLITRYTYDDLVKGKPLPGTHDPGWGEKISTIDGPRYNADLAVAAANAYLFHAAPSAAQIDTIRISANPDFTFRLCYRFALLVYQLPSLTFSHHLPNQVDIWENDREPSHIGYGALGQGNPGEWCPYYDQLFPYISHSKRLAAALSRHIPWIREPADVVRLFDTNLIQYTAKLFRYYRITWGAGAAEPCIRLATIMNNAEASRPTMEWLTSRDWVYPQPLGGFMDNLSIQTTREGGTTIGSYFYGQSNRLEFVKVMRAYYKASGDKAWDLSNPRHYPKLAAALSFPMAARVAGYYPPGIGDVGGPTVRWPRWFENVVESARMMYERTGKPGYAAILRKFGSRKNETKEEWADILARGKSVRDAMLTRRSRVQSDWQVILESGSEYDDLRAKAAVSIRIGTGAGHAHADTMDLRLWANGVCMSGDAGQRGGYGEPEHSSTRVHNLVEVNQKNHAGHAWCENLADMTGAEYTRVQMVYPSPAVSLYRREVMLVRTDLGNIPPGFATRSKDAGVVLPTHYVIDITRVRGGTVHTYCFHGAVDDQFTINVPHRLHPTGTARKYLAPYFYDPKYLAPARQFYLGGPKITGDLKTNDDADETLEEAVPASKRAPELFEPWQGKIVGNNLVATWRLERPSEEWMLSNAAVATPARKFTRLTLFNQKDATIMHGLCISHPDRHASRNICFYAARTLFARHEAKTKQPLSSSFAAIIEPFAGESKISQSRLLPITPHEPESADAPVAVEVKLKQGRRDLSFFAPTADTTYTAASGEVFAGEAALIATDSSGVVQAALTGGRLLKSKDIEIRPSQTAYTATISGVDYRELQLNLDTAWPASILDGLYFEAGNALHHTAYAIHSLRTKNGESTIQLTGALEIFRSRVMGLSGNTIFLSTARSLPRGRNKGLVGLTEDYSKSWRVESLGAGDRWTGHGFRLTGAPVKKSDFPGGSGLVIAELGPGDHLRLPTMVNLRRIDKSTWAVEASVPFTLRLQGVSALSVSLDSQTWQKVERKDGTFLLNPISLQHRNFRIRKDR